ncbi:glycosyltransferase family 1 protein [Dyella sp. A6]|uniref:glycosyltransferase family 4 protein n=1 Tax=Dyella aluminiiresistens TaxID=3069105 RepID=UPI002E7811D4|nr:glycosyltransferase family 1 protein [Dyella sp. A6]
MRIVIDMQGAQGESRFRGIGRHTMSFVQALAKNRGEHELILVLSGAFPESVRIISDAFRDLLPVGAIRVWNAAMPLCAIHAENEARIKVAERMREAFIESLGPDLVHIISLFEGFGDDAVVSVGTFDDSTPVSVVLHDLIPLLNPSAYLDSNPRYADYYRRRIDYLRRASCYLAISDFSRQEAINALTLSSSHVTNMRSAVEGQFRLLKLDNAACASLKSKFCIWRQFVLYAGGCDPRKNLPRLIRAYAALSDELRAKHQLVLAGKMPDGNVEQLRVEAQKAGLSKDELIFTGYVSDEELLWLYNDAVMFVFPSLHEGFGLPALEAMACGTPVIAANTSSLPEVVGWDAALFDPNDQAAMTGKMSEVLTSPTFRQALRKHGLEQAKLFSWDITARRALEAWERCIAGSQRPTHRRGRGRGALIDALGGELGGWTDSALLDLAWKLAQNETNGIRRQLLVDVSELCQHDAATGVQRVVRSYLAALLSNPPAGYTVEPVYATLEQGYRYARRFTAKLLGEAPAEEDDCIIDWQRGDIFFGLDLQHHVQLKHADFYRQLRADGVTVKFLVYDLLPIQFPELFSLGDLSAYHVRLLAMIAGTDGAICISEATASAYADWLKKENVPTDSAFALQWNHIGGDLAGSLPSRGLPDDADSVFDKLRARPSFLCVSTLEPRKCQQQILDAVEALWADGEDVNLVLVGQSGWKTEALAKRIETHPENGHRLFWLRGISDEYLEQIYAYSTCLIAASLNEGFGLSLVEAAKHGLAIVARDIPVFHEVAGDHAYYFRGADARELAVALTDWLALYLAGKHPRSKNLHWLSWSESAEHLKDILVEGVCSQQFLVDVSELIKRDVGTGIQRVVRSILGEWFNNPPQNYRVEPVYASVDAQGYRYARKFTEKFFGHGGAHIEDAPVEFGSGDVFFGLDLQPLVVSAHRKYFEEMMAQGVTVGFLIHDLLSVRMPEHFPAGAEAGFADWLETIAGANTVIAVSKAVARDFSDWLDERHRTQHPRIGWSHNGADIQSSSPSRGMPVRAIEILTLLRERPSLLMVGTIEPRKGHSAVLDACDALWRRGEAFNLVIVGKQGWKSDELAARLRKHPEFGRRLHWLEGISDEYLEQVYASSACLVAASEGEGFGLPLIEAAQHGLPILARDIPVFREVAQNHATYFPEHADSETLARSIEVWLEAYRQGHHVRSEGMQRLTWAESAQNLLALLLGNGVPPSAQVAWLGEKGETAGEAIEWVNVEPSAVSK